ncbi:hypothetical protein [Dapis sp. BLCC M229]
MSPSLTSTSISIWGAKGLLEGFWEQFPQSVEYVALVNQAMKSKELH